MSDSDDLFITQNTFSTKAQHTFDSVDVSPRFEDFLDNMVVPVGTVGNFNLEYSLDVGHINSSDEELLHTTQEFEAHAQTAEHLEEQSVPQSSIKTSTTGRFGKPLSEMETTSLKRVAVNKNTEKKCQWAVRIFDTWFGERHGTQLNIGEKLLELNDSDLCHQLILFVTEVKNQRGTDYQGNTIHEILMSIQYFLRENGRNINFNTDFNFFPLRKILDAKMRSLAQSGIGVHKKKADIITRDQEDMLWEQGLLGEDTPQKLIDTVFYLNGINFCLRGGEEHHSLKIGDKSNFSTILRNNVKHLKYSEGLSKTNNGGFSHRDLTPKIVEIKPNQEKPSRCLVRLYEKYMSLRPKTCNAFYVRPLKYPKRDTWYCAVPVGRHTLSGVVKRLCTNAGFVGFYTNHSLRATTATRLYDSGIDEQLIAERTGHRSTAIRGYKRTSSELLQVVDDVVQGKKSKKNETTGDVDEKLQTDKTCNMETEAIKLTMERNGAKITLTL